MVLKEIPTENITRPLGRNEVIGLLFRLTIFGAVTYFTIKWMVDAIDPTRKQKVEAQKQAEKLMRQIGVQNVKLSEYEMSIAAHLVDPLTMQITWRDIAGLDEVITELKDTVILPVQKRHLFEGSRLLQPPKASVPQLCYEGSTVKEPTQILNFLRKQRFNADYELTAKQEADTMAYIALLEEKLRPALLHTFWVDAENYANQTRPWFSSRSPFPLNFFVPGRQASLARSRILLTKGESPLLNITEVEGKIYSEAKECLNLLSHRLGRSHYYFGSTPTSLDAFVFGHIAPLLKAPLPNGQLQTHLNLLGNLCQFCNTILKNYFTDDTTMKIKDYSLMATHDPIDANLQKLTQLVNKESNLIEKMDDNLRSSPQHKPHRNEAKPSLLATGRNSTPA